MSCKKCGKSKCGCPEGSGGITTSQLAAEIAQITDEVNTITTAIQAFISGHPILMIQNPDDIACFNLSTGLGSTTWAGWGLCNGTSYYNAITNKNIISPNLLDKFIVGALGTYAVNDTGGADSVSLSANQNGTHTHTIIDGGHSHNITDPGHTHAIVDPGHTHSGVSTPVTVPPFQTSVQSNSHNHGYAAPSVTIGYTSGSSSANTSNLSANDNTTDERGETHTHTVTIPPFVVASMISTSYTGVYNQSAFIGITQTDVATTGITMNSSGLGSPHENRPPFYALIFCIKI